MVKRSFLGRGPTLAELNRATQAERARKAAATAQALGQTTQVNTTNTAAANSVTPSAATQPIQAKSVAIGTDARGRQIVVGAQTPSSNSLKAVQQLQAQNQPARTVSTAPTNNAQKSSGFVAPGRQSRQGPVTGRNAVQGKRLSEFQAEEAAARATALQNAAVNK